MKDEKENNAAIVVGAIVFIAVVSIGAALYFARKNPPTTVHLTW